MHEQISFERVFLFCVLVRWINMAKQKYIFFSSSSFVRSLVLLNKLKPNTTTSTTKIWFRFFFCWCSGTLFSSHFSCPEASELGNWEQDRELCVRLELICFEVDSHSSSCSNAKFMICVTTCDKVSNFWNYNWIYITHFAQGAIPHRVESRPSG